MKKILLFLIASLLLCSMTACGAKEKAADAPKTAETEVGTEDSGKTKAEEASVDYWVIKDNESLDVVYHTKDCNTIKDKELENLPEEIVKTLGMTACEVCKP